MKEPIRFWTQPTVRVGLCRGCIGARTCRRCWTEKLPLYAGLYSGEPYADCVALHVPGKRCPRQRCECHPAKRAGEYVQDGEHQGKARQGIRERGVSEGESHSIGHLAPGKDPTLWFWRCAWPLRERVSGEPTAAHGVAGTNRAAGMVHASI